MNRIVTINLADCRAPEPRFNGLDEYDLLLDFRRNGPLTLSYPYTKAKTHEPHARSLH